MREIRFFVNNKLIAISSEYQVPRIGEHITFDVWNLSAPVNEYIVEKVCRFYTTIDEERNHSIVEPENSVEVHLRLYREID